MKHRENFRLEMSNETYNEDKRNQNNGKKNNKQNRQLVSQRSLKKRFSELEYLNFQDDEDTDLVVTSESIQQQNKPMLEQTSSDGQQQQQQQQDNHMTNLGTGGGNIFDASRAANDRPMDHQDTNSVGHRHDLYMIPASRLAVSQTTAATAAHRLTGIDEDDGSEADPNSLVERPDSGGSRSFGYNVTKNLLWTVLASTVGASFQHGYNGGVVNAPEKLIGRFINDTFMIRYGQYATDSQIDLLFAIIVSIFCIGGCLGALMTPLIADRFGRKQGLIYNNVIVLIACPLMASSKSLSSYELLIFGRVLIGINAGLNAGLAPLYMNEISPTNLRGSLGTIYQLVITISILLSNVFGLPSLFGQEHNWPILFLIPVLPGLFMLFALPKCFESPKHLLINQGHELQAQQALAWFRETGEVQDEMEELKLEQELNKLSPDISLKMMFNQLNLRKPLIISIIIMLSQQFSGINAVLFYSTSIFRSAGLDQVSAIKATLGMSLVNVLMTIVSLFLVDRAGRRTLLMSGLSGMAITSIILALCLGPQPEESSSHGPISSLIAVISVYLFIIMFASGPGSIPWFLVAELFPSNARPLASGIAVSVNWLANFTVSLCFLPLSNIFHGYTFFLFAILLFIFYLFTYYKVPETKGATAEEISALFKR